MNFQPFPAWRDNNPLRPLRTEAVGGLLAAFDQHRLDYHRRRIGVGNKLGRIHGNQTFDGGKPERPVSGAKRPRQEPILHSRVGRPSALP